MKWFLRFTRIYKTVLFIILCVFLYLTMAFGGAYVMVRIEQSKPPFAINQNVVRLNEGYILQSFTIKTRRTIACGELTLYYQLEDTEDKHKPLGLDSSKNFDGLGVFYSDEVYKVSFVYDASLNEPPNYVTYFQVTGVGKGCTITWGEFAQEDIIIGGG
jgi:hypothetical protein